MSGSTQAIAPTDRFFGRMVNLVPPSFYLDRTLEEEEEMEKAKFYKHQRLALSNLEKKKRRKKAQKQRFDPFSIRTTRQEIAYRASVDEERRQAQQERAERLEKKARRKRRKQEEQEEQEKEEEKEEQEEVTQEVTQEESGLRARYRQRMEELRSMRGDGKSKKKKVRRDRRKERGDPPRPGSNPSSNPSSHGDVSRYQRSEEGGEMLFGKVVEDRGDEEGSKKRLKDFESGKATKVRKLKQRLKDVQDKNREMQGLGEEERRERLWEESLRAAQGEKHAMSGTGSAQKIKRVLKRKEKAKAKSTKAWQQRKKEEEDGKKERQERRNRNIQEKIKRKQEAF